MCDPSLWDCCSDFIRMSEREANTDPNLGWPGSLHSRHSSELMTKLQHRGSAHGSNNGNNANDRSQWMPLLGKWRSRNYVPAVNLRLQWAKFCTTHGKREDLVTKGHLKCISSWSGFVHQRISNPVFCWRIEDLQWSTGCSLSLAVRQQPNEFFTTLIRVAPSVGQPPFFTSLGPDGAGRWFSWHRGKVEGSPELSFAGFGKPLVVFWKSEDVRVMCVMWAVGKAVGGCCRRFTWLLVLVSWWIMVDLGLGRLGVGADTTVRSKRRINWEHWLLHLCLIIFNGMRITYVHCTTK